MMKIIHLDRNPDATDLAGCEYKDVSILHARFFDHAKAPRPMLLDDNYMAFRFKFLEEELQELRDAHKSASLMGAADALVDLVYVAMGTAWWMNLPWENLWENVHTANLKKLPGATKRGHRLDMVKPQNWQPPDHTNALIRHGWHPRDTSVHDPLEFDRQ